MYPMSLLLLVAVAVLPLCLAQQRVNTHGESGVMCGTSRCIKGVPCVNGKCHCDDKRGHGSFVCPPKDVDLCFFNNDPILHTFGGTRVDVPLMNKVLMSHISTKKCKKPKAARGPRIECDVRIFAWGHRRLGKLFIKGLEVKVFLAKGWLLYNHAVRLQAGMNGDLDHEFVEEGNHNFLGNPPYGNPVKTHVAHGNTIKTEYDRVNNFAKVVVADCGVTAAIRGVDFTGKIDFHEQEPGIYIEVDKKCEPDYLSLEHSMCSSPQENLQVQQEYIQKAVGRNVTLHTMMVMKALYSDSFQDHPDAPTILWSLAETASECDSFSLVDAVENCTFIFEYPKFHNCFDTEEDDVKALALYNNCIFAICDRNKAMCDLVQLETDNSKCPVPENTIMDHKCDFEESSRK